MEGIELEVKGVLDSSGKYKLLEVDDSLLAELQRGSVSIRGNNDGDAALCTSECTESIQTAETSNSLLVVNPCSESVHIIETVCHSTVVTSRIRPRLHHLRSLLLERPYFGVAVETRGGRKRGNVYTFEELSKQVQVSDHEIHQHLEDSGAFLLEGKWRLVEPSVMNTVLDMILSIMTEKGMPVTRVPRNFMVKELEDYEELIVDQCLKQYGECVDNDSNGEYWYSLKEKEICVFRARQLLQASGTDYSWRVGDFLDTWRGTLPTGLSVDLSLSMLKGLVYVEPVAVPVDASLSTSEQNSDSSHLPDDMLVFFPEDSLSVNIPERMKSIFLRKTKWTAAQIEPYICGVMEPTYTVEQFLMKYARPNLKSADGEERTFSSR